MRKSRPFRNLSCICGFTLSAALGWHVFDSLMEFDRRTVLWSSSFEDGYSRWYFPSTKADTNAGGGEFDSGSTSSTLSQDYAHSGRYSLKMTIAAPPESGVRMFRWLESQTHEDLYYSVWYYLPQQYRVARYWNIFQWKSKIPATGQVDPFFILNIGNRRNGAMFVYLYDWQTERSYTQILKELPVAQWFNITAHYVCAGDNTGQVTFWQDGTQLFDIRDVQTRYSDGDCQWGVNNYSDGLVPSPTVLYIDDAKIFIPNRPRGALVQMIGDL